MRREGTAIRRAQPTQVTRWCPRGHRVLHQLGIVMSPNREPAVFGRVRQYGEQGVGVKTTPDRQLLESEPAVTRPVVAGSIGIPGPMVVETVIFRMYRPLAADGFARRISSRAAR